MYLSLIIISIVYVEVTGSIRCFNCLESSNDKLSGKTSTCTTSNLKDAPTCDNGDVCLVTTQYYTDPHVGTILITWRQCGSSASFPEGASTDQCSENDPFFKQQLYIDHNLCCYTLGYNQTEYLSNVTYCYCTDNECNDKLYGTKNFTSSTSDPSASPPSNRPGMSTTFKSTSVGTRIGPDLQSVGFIGAIMIPIVSTAVVSVTMILSAVCLWKMSTG